MKLKEIFIPTKVASNDTTVCQVFAECARANVPALPFCTKSGRIIGRVTLKNILKITCLPDYMVESARILGEEMTCMEDIEAKAAQLLDTPVKAYIQEPHALSLGSESPVIKALAMMEQNDTSYLFVVDNGQYQGAVTIQCLARELTRLGAQC